MLSESQGDQWDSFHRAVDYPYHRPQNSYLFYGGNANSFAEHDRYRKNKIPVIAFGSNQSPYQLKLKFGTISEDQAILVERCFIEGFDVGHAARLTKYGAFPAILIPINGVRVEVAITWLTESQLKFMDSTEAIGSSYVREKIGPPARTYSNEIITDALFYRTLHKPLRVGGRLVASSSTNAKKRSFPAFSNKQLLALANLQYSPETSFKQFLRRTINDNLYRLHLCEQLRVRGLK